MSFYRIDNISPHTDFSPYAETAKAKPVEGEKTDGGVSFGDILDVVNPLQHIPVVSTIYRSATGDEISPVSRIIGDTIFGQLYGLISSVVNVVVEAITGKDIGGHVMTALKGDSPKTDAVASSDKSDPLIYSEGVKKYTEAKEILTSKNHGVDSYTSIMA